MAMNKHHSGAEGEENSYRGCLGIDETFLRVPPGTGGLMVELNSVRPPRVVVPPEGADPVSATEASKDGCEVAPTWRAMTPTHRGAPIGTWLPWLDHVHTFLDSGGVLVVAMEEHVLAPRSGIVPAAMLFRNYLGLLVRSVVIAGCAAGKTVLPARCGDEARLGDPWGQAMAVLAVVDRQKEWGQDGVVERLLGEIETICGRPRRGERRADVVRVSGWWMRETTSRLGNYLMFVLEDLEKRVAGGIDYETEMERWRVA